MLSVEATSQPVPVFQSSATRYWLVSRKDLRVYIPVWRMFLAGRRLLFRLPLPNHLLDPAASDRLDRVPILGRDAHPMQALIWDVWMA
jgi:hypothetical protein